MFVIGHLIYYILLLPLGADSVVSGSLGGAGLHLCYYQQASEQLQLGVELDTNFRLQDSVATIGYQVQLPKADLCFRGKGEHLND
jgi:mitochondrial import receptor subunit TOM40